MENSIVITNPSVISALKQQRKDRYKFEKHIHKTVEVYQILSGQCKMDISNDTISCQEGDIIMIMPNTVHSFYLTSNDTCEFNHIHFSPSLFSKLFISIENGNKIDLITASIIEHASFYKTVSDDNFTQLITSIIEKNTTNTPIMKAYVNLYITELLLYILEKSEKRIVLTKSSTAKNSYVSFTLNYIQEHWSDKILINDISSSLNISSRYLSKIFFEHMNITILNYINTYRINKAIDLMMSTNLSLTEISAQIGLKDSQHFSKLFTNIIGISPYKYRKMLHDINF